MKTSYSIAIVDDDRDSHIFLKLNIQRLNPAHTCLSYYDARSFVLYLSEKGGSQQPLPDFIILDLSMPEMDGYDVLKVIKGNSLFKDIKVFVLTSGQYEYDRIKSIAYGCTNYYMKPMNSEDFNTIIEDMFKQVQNPSLETTVLKEENKY
ncbi:MAG TPA: response regulator [Bacteroidia bacterium]|jgi:DNA-binding response OmpR family regulator|nr:response regulator [Bacteroidia bacterium]